LGEVGKIRLDPMPATPTPNDQRQLGFRRIAGRHRRAGSDFIVAYPERATLAR
jgi:hypothetical protein